MTGTSLLRPCPPSRWPARRQRRARLRVVSSKCAPARETADEQSSDRKEPVVTSLAPGHLRDLAIPQPHHNICERCSLYTMRSHDRRSILLASEVLQEFKDQVSVD